MASPSIIETQLQLGDRIVPVNARINRRAKRLILRVDSITGIVHVTAPSKRALPDALKFAKERSLWIEKELGTGPTAHPFIEGGSCYYRGIPHEIIRDGGPRTPIRCTSLMGADNLDSSGNLDSSDILDSSGKVTGSTSSAKIYIGGEQEHLNRRLTDWLKHEAKRILTLKSDYYAERLNKKRGKIRIGDTRTRWGSCSQDGTLSYSWRLIMAPAHILDYVAAHECTHLVHLNHSPAYWRLLAELDVDAKTARQWFKIHGTRLFSYGITPPP